MVVLLFWEREKKCLEIWAEGIQREFLPERKGKIIPRRWPKTEKAQEPAVEILVRGILRLRVSKAQRRVLEASGSILIVLNALVILFSIWNTSLVRKYEPDLTQKIPSRFTLTATSGLLDFIISWRRLLKRRCVQHKRARTRDVVVWTLSHYSSLPKVRF